MHKVKVKNKKIVIIIIICIAAVTYFSLRGCSKNGNMIFRYESIAKGDVRKTVSTSGNLELTDPIMVLSNAGGLVTHVYVDFNSKVTKNQLLASFDTSDIDQQILKIDSQRKSLALDMLTAKKDLNAKKDMLKDNLISEKGLEQAELEYKKIDIQFEQIQNDYEIAKKNRNNTRITAPASGVITSMDIQPNIPVPANKVVFVIAVDLTKMRLIIQVDESDIGNIKTDQKVTFSVSAYPEKVFEGKISQVRLNPIKRGEIVSYQALVTCDNKALLLKPGMTATATVEVGVKLNVLRVRNEAFLVSPVDVENNSGKKYLWKKQSSPLNTLPVKRIEVNTGLMGDDYTEVITSKIKEGDEILVGINKGSSESDSSRK